MDGETRRQRNERFDVDTPEAPVLDPDFDYLMDWFWELHQGRSMGMGDGEPLSFTEIEAWVRLTGTVIRREEVRILMTIDRAYLHAKGEERQAQEERRSNR